MTIPDNTAAPEVEPKAPAEDAPATPPAEGDAEQPKPAEKEYVEKKDMTAFADEIVRRISQSTKARTQAIEDQIKSQKTLLEGAGIKIDASQEAELRKKVAETLEDQDVSPAPQGAAVQGQDAINAFTAEVFETEGVSITPNDPEWKELEKALKDPRGSMAKYTKVLHDQVAAKKERVEVRRENADARTPSGASERTAPDVVYDPTKPVSHYLEQAK